MAVDKQKVIVRLKALFPKANLSQQRLDAIADKLAKKPADDADETAIDAVINDFNDVLSIEDIAKGDDRTRTLEADKKKAEELAAKKKPAPAAEEEEEVETEGMTPFEKQMLKKFGELKTDLDNIKSGNVKQSKLEQAKSLLEKSEVFKKLDDETKGFMLKNVELESETPFEEQITGLEGVFSKMIQTNADTNQYAPGAGQGLPSNAVDEKLVGDIVDAL
jgi:hypothetical protein